VIAGALQKRGRENSQPGGDFGLLSSVHGVIQFGAGGRVVWKFCRPAGAAGPGHRPACSSEVSKPASVWVKSP
jgi:hypothetical protein